MINNKTQKKKKNSENRMKKMRYEVLTAASAKSVIHLVSLNIIVKSITKDLQKCLTTDLSSRVDNSQLSPIALFSNNKKFLMQKPLNTPNSTKHSVCQTPMRRSNNKKT